jgi:outer membrane protein OmpA-like peptidoglycan-associated protein
MFERMKTFGLLVMLSLMLLMTTCKTTSQLYDGEEAYNYKQFPLAIELLQQEIKKTRYQEIVARKSFLVGDSYVQMNEHSKAIEWFRKAIENEYGREALQAYGFALMRDQQYGNAEKLFEKLLNEYGHDDRWSNALKSCQSARILIAQQKTDEFKATSLGLNSNAADYVPVFMTDQMLYTSDKETSKGSVYPWTGRQHADIYSESDDGKIKKLLRKINTEYNEGTLTINTDGDHVIFTRCGEMGSIEAEQFCKLYETKWDGERWMDPAMLNFCKENTNYGHPTFFHDDLGIIFSSNDPNGLGSYDLWSAYKRGEEWIEPTNLPPGINSAFDEKFPSMVQDTLYFSTDGMVGMGGLDIYYSQWIRPDLWTKPIHLDPPYNSGGDDFNYLPDPYFRPDDQILKRVFISSDRKQGKGQDDIWVIEKYAVEKTDSTGIAPVVEILIEGKVLEKIYRDPEDPNSRVVGNRPLPGSSVMVSKQQEIESFDVDAQAEFKWKAVGEGRYKFTASKAGYLNSSRIVDIKKLSQDERKSKTYVVYLVLDKIHIGKEIVMEDIYYDFDKWIIREDAKPALDTLAMLLRDNPTIRIELSSHTDCRGSDVYNSELSQRRAQSAVDYLINQGIGVGRMSAVGYGENRPKVNCICEDCTEEQHQQNRRTSFTILE